MSEYYGGMQEPEYDSDHTIHNWRHDIVKWYKCTGDERRLLKTKEEVVFLARGRVTFYRFYEGPKGDETCKARLVILHIHPCVPVRRRHTNEGLRQANHVVKEFHGDKVKHTKEVVWFEGGNGAVMHMFFDEPEDDPTDSYRSLVLCLPRNVPVVRNDCSESMNNALEHAPAKCEASLCNEYTLNEFALTLRYHREELEAARALYA